MNAAKSKFDFCNFNSSGYHHFMVNAGKYTQEEAIEIYKKYCWFSDKPFIVEKSHVKWRAGINEDYEPCVGWWGDYSPTEKRSVETWAFRFDYSTKEAQSEIPQKA